MNDTITTDPITALRGLARIIRDSPARLSRDITNLWADTIKDIANQIDDNARMSAALAPDPTAAIAAIGALNECRTVVDLSASWIGMQPLMEAMSTDDQGRVTRRYLTRLAVLERGDEK